MTPEFRDQLLRVLSPNGWNLLANLFDQGGVKNLAARAAVETEDFLLDVIQNDQFAKALSMQEESVRQRRQRRPLTLDKINGEQPQPQPQEKSRY